MKASLILCTCPSAEVGQQLAKALVTEELAACVNIVGSVDSVYRWQGEVCKASEVLLLIKTLEERYEQVEQRIGQLHPFDCPELIKVEISRGEVGYMQWLAQQVGGFGAEQKE